MINETYYYRRLVIAGLAVAVAIVYVVKLFSLQIIDQKTKDRADSNALLKQTQYPSRGLIYDRNGELLVYNQPIYDVMVIFNEMGKNFDTLAFCRTLGIEREEFNERAALIKSKKNRGYSKYVSQVFATQLTGEDIAQLQQTIYKFPGISIRKRTLRSYTFAAAAQVLGSVGEVSQQHIDNDDYYTAGDYIGRDGIERTYEKLLRGDKGVEILLRDSRGVIQGKYKDGEEDLPPVSGTDLNISLDIKLQMVAEQLLEGKIGSAVAIEPATGEILALASAPTWDPKMLVGRVRSKNYTMLASDPKKPLYNRATQATYPPGSTFKTLQALICLQEKAITPYTAFPCSGKASKPIACTHSHGSPVTLLEALEQSCNPYFWYAYRELLEKNGGNRDIDIFRQNYDTWRKDVMSAGLGQRFQEADLSEQSAGFIPSVEYYDKHNRGKNKWKASTIRSNSIGQGEVLVTPLQLCNMAAMIANDGYYITPHLVRNDTMLNHRHESMIDKKHFAIVKEGMERVMTNGTGRYYQIEGIRMGGKTGTAQVHNKKDNALFIGIAPIDDPKIVVAVVVENIGFGATWAAPIASLMIEQYLTDTIRRHELFEQKRNYRTYED